MNSDSRWTIGQSTGQLKCPRLAVGSALGTRLELLEIPTLVDGFPQPDRVDVREASRFEPRMAE